MKLLSKRKCFISVILAEILLLMLTACGKTGQPAPADPPVTQEKETVVTAADGMEITEEESWKVELAEELLEQYGVLPKSYKELENGMLLVYCEVGGEVIPVVTVDPVTVEYQWYPVE